MSLPGNCAACTMWIDKLCHRHAPSPRVDVVTPTNHPTFWPTTLPHQRCGVGSTTDQPIMCDKCKHWWQPDGKPIPMPVFGMGKSKEWWDHSGYCTRSAPGPTSSAGQAASWGVTSTIEIGCGDGEAEDDDGLVE